MKSFYGLDAASALDPVAVAGAPATAIASVSYSYIRTRARIAVYDGLDVAPRVEEIASAEVSEYIEALTLRVHELSRAAGGPIPYTVIREVAENFIHADFAEPVVSIMDDGRTIRFADQGPGIADKERALQPGFTTARGDIKRYIRGVGSGLPLVREYLSGSGGSLVIEDNLGSGSVVTIRSRAAGGAALVTPVAVPPRSHEARLDTNTAEPPNSSSMLPGPGNSVRLTTRQKQVLALVLESGSAGPSLVAKELGIGISTAYRDLASLEEMALISAQGGKRNLTQSGLSYLDALAAK